MPHLEFLDSKVAAYEPSDLTDNVERCPTVRLVKRQYHSFLEIHFLQEQYCYESYNCAIDTEPYQFALAND